MIVNLMGEANLQIYKLLGGPGAGGEGHVSHSTMLRTVRIKELLESDSGGFQAMSGKVMMPIALHKRILGDS